MFCFGLSSFDDLDGDSVDVGFLVLLVFDVPYPFRTIFEFLHVRFALDNGINGRCLTIQLNAFLEITGMLLTIDFLDFLGTFRHTKKTEQ